MSKFQIILRFVVVCKSCVVFATTCICYITTRNHLFLCAFLIALEQNKNQFEFNLLVCTFGFNIYHSTPHNDRSLANNNLEHKQHSF